ncbi:MAG: bifunctional glutamate N-acetyltransferase/amino-acid acetyltransferase ArgJ [Planctomycetia bacterium]|nr:bifunctional glutamate N-acetyltransferase/amino-acid acetyltransferase ArgJ [Planctomycetia bacterium]
MSSVELPIGFQTSGVACGVRGDVGRLDLALFVSDRPAVTVGVFTQNLVCGAPVKVCRERVPRTTGRAVVINSGNANAATGDRGIADAKRMTAAVAQSLNCSADDVVVCSTGVIGRFLPMEKLEAGIPHAAAALANTAGAFELSARAIMTTDTVPKQATRSAELRGTNGVKTVRVSGVCKGAAMIAPNMATMLCVIMTDADLVTADADNALRQAVNQSFNCISVEGHTSTSDTVLFLANGAAGTGSLDADSRAKLQTMLDEVATELSTAIIRDAEGATHFITLDVNGARTRDEAFRIAKTIADSPLVKTAIHGADPNWGRIVSAAGYAGVPMREEDMSLRINNLDVYRDGAPLPFDPKTVSDSIRDNRDTHIELTLKLGNANVRYWTADLTAEYVRLNADYTT